MDNYQVFEHPDFTIHVPTAWENISLSGFEAVFVVPPFPDGPGANVSISILEFTKVMSLQEVSDQLKTLQQRQYPEYHMVDEQGINLHQIDGFKRSYTWLNTAQNIPIAQFQIIFLGSSRLKAYILTATRPSNMDEVEGQAIDRAFAEISETFQINN